MWCCNIIVPQRILEDIYGAMKTLLSESHYHQQDLNAIRDDLGALKFGFALLQDATTDLSADSSGQNYKLQQIKSTLQHQGEKIEYLGECLEEHKTSTTDRFDALEIRIEEHESNNTEQLNILQTTVDAIEHPCGGSEDWVQVIDFDMTEPGTMCPSGWADATSTFQLPTCGRGTQTGTSTCFAASFPFEGGVQSFSKVCGRIRAYAYGGVDAFENFQTLTAITQSYVSGVSLTAGDNYAEHLWTFAAGLAEIGRNDRGGFEPEIDDQCPCDRAEPSDIPVPSFVGNKYFCEAGINLFDGTFLFQADDPLWDGLNCNPKSRCCEYNRPPYFVNNLGKTLTFDEIDARICVLQSGPTMPGNNGDDILVEAMELYVAA